MSKITFRLYLLVLIFAPLAFGTMETWSRAFMEAGLFLATLLFFIVQLNHPSRTIYRCTGLLPLLLFLGYLLLQITPLPAGLLKFISPAAFYLRGPTVGLSAPEGWLTISLTPKETLVEFFRFASYIAVYFLTVQLLGRRKMIATVVRALIILALLIAIEALFQKLTSGGLIYWFRAPSSLTPIGPYVYRNHYAGFMEMIFPLTLCLFLYTKPYSGAALNMRQRLIAFLDDPQVNAHAFYGISATFIATTIFVSLSRGGIISLSCALLVMAFILRYRGQLGGNRYWFILVPAVTMVFVSWFGWGIIVERFLKIHHAEKIIYDSRFDIWINTIPMIRDFIFTGSGFGSYEKIFPFFQKNVAWQVVIDHAHNDYLELLATGGLTSFLLLALFLASVVRKTWPVWRRRHDRYVVFLTSGCLVAIASLLLHGFVDFNFYNGANVLYFFIICGLLVAVSHSKKGESVRPTSLLRKLPANRSTTITGIIAASLLLTSSLYFNLGVMKGEYRYRDVRATSLDSSTPQEKLQELQALTSKLSSWDPLEAKYRYSAGNVALFMDNREMAAEHYRKALDLDPTDSWSLLQLGQLLASDGDPQGLKMMAAAVRYAPFNLEVLKRYNHLLLWLGEKEMALAVSGRILTLTKGGKEALKHFALLSEYTISAEDIHQITPKEPALLMILGNFLVKSEKAAEARPIYDEVIALAAKAPAPRPGFFTTPCWYFIRQKNLPRAQQAAEKGLKVIPEDAGLHYVLGEVLRRSEEFDAAEKSFRRAIELAPVTPSYHRQLATVQTALGKHDEATSSFQKAVALAPGNIGLRLQLAAHLVRRNEAGQADNEYDIARKLLENSDKPRPWYFNSLRHYYLKNNRLNEALSLMEMAVKTYPDNPGVHIQLGDIYLKRNSPYRAELSFRKALELDPDSQAATNRLISMNAL